MPGKVNEGQSMDIFTLKGVSAGYDRKEIIHGVDITVSPGEFLAMIGPNGAGKSTLLKTMTGGIVPTKGAVLFRDRALRNWHGTALAREMSVVHQAMEQIQAYTVREFIRLGRFPHQNAWEIESRDDTRLINEATAICGVEHLSSRSINELSGGEVQLVCIARALTQNRDVILLDEPVSHLDVKHTLKIMDILHELNRQGATVITVLHDLNLASDYCKRIIGIKEGRIFFDGAPQEVITYDRIEALFDIVCVVRENPISGKPFAYGVPGYVGRDSKK